MQKKLNSKGFTLIELLIVIGIIGFLAAAVLVAVDPVKRIQDSRDARRYSEANGLLNAILTKQVDDRALYNATASSGTIITNATNSQVIVTSDVGVACDLNITGVSNYPGCNQTLDTAVGATITGTINTNVGAAITGTGTSFTTALKVGDVIYNSTTPAKNCTILAITSDTALTCTATPGTLFANGDAIRRASKNCVANLSDTMTGPGTVSITSGTSAMTGTSTAFLTWLHVGDTITVSGQTFTVSSITSDTALTTTANATATITNVASPTYVLKNPIVPNYIASAPIDPRGANTTICSGTCTTPAAGITTLGATNTGYYLHRTSGNRIEVGACSPEQAAAVSVKR